MCGIDGVFVFWVGCGIGWIDVCFCRVDLVGVVSKSWAGLDGARVSV